MPKALTLPETLIAGSILSAVLLAVALGVANVRSGLKERQVKEVLAFLNQAVGAYHKATGTWPSDTRPPPRTPTSDHDQGSADRVIALLAGVPAARIQIDRIRPVFRVPLEQPPLPTTTAPAWGTIQDAWGRRLRCLTTASPAPSDQEAVAANAGRPVFVSAGPDGDFGTLDIAATADNIRSDGR
ncbi:MAG TPA: hypothetical protein PKY77_16165 [Phycisphaerae bacterium]|nr:hypothetical protein [Phycisphaerae bacterium]HSA29226.1 hypothetical protein [Phycisphaerae bacterium]